MNTKRVNIFTHYENEESKKMKITPPTELRKLCVWHNRYCGPNHERFWIEEEQRWMNSWEEYKYVQTQDYYEDKVVQFCGATVLRPCVICGELLEDHYAKRLCHDKTLRLYFNKYTNAMAGIPRIHSTRALYGWDEKWTQ